ncbi:hypothetical protein [Lewinella sp. W8]|uniref:hypothetical protein n=1 Tax=Lewinella sp. W8 TaxID=2528208 RepID=UPI0010687C04|nr:hypothetical protein [Lewinella sp. W8]MTB52510.1 hypothetical protein [Lewinella sp. W8]
MKKHWEKIVGGLVLGVIFALVLQFIPWGSFDGFHWDGEFWGNVVTYSLTFILVEYLAGGSKDYVARRNQRWKVRREREKGSE